MEKEKREESFFDKYKKDSRYKAKVQLIGWVLFILLLILWINISSVFSNNSFLFSNYINNVEYNEEDTNLINKLKNNNYSFKLEINKNKNDINDFISYEGSVFNNTKMVNKNYNDNISEYYINNNNFYLKNNEVYTLVNSSNYYSFVSETFIEISTIINYINNGTLNSTKNEDNKTIKEYYVYLKDIVLNKSEDYIIVNVISEENNVLIFDIDYTKLYNLYDTEIVDELKIKYYITDFDKVEKFNDINIK